MKTFNDVFAADPEVSAAAPGRVNLLGEHTDYNDGYVLPTAIPQHTRVALRRNGRAHFRLYAAELDQSARFSADQPPATQFARYVYGCVRVLAQQQMTVPPLDIHIHSDVPMGVGVSSSAALEVAFLRGVRALLQLPLDDVSIAQLAQQAEIEHAGVRVGIMDQMASSLADTRHMLFIDTRTLERRLLPLPAGAEILVIDSGVPRALATSHYNERRAECEQAARLLGVAALRDGADAAAVERLPEPYRRRARHVVAENNRVLPVLGGISAAAFGELMNASHASLRDDFEVSIAPLDRLVDSLQHQPAVFGARLTGAGFGGACVALCRDGQARQVAETVLTHYRALGHRGRLLVPPETSTGFV
jgi:galactokinase